MSRKQLVAAAIAVFLAVPSAASADDSFFLGLLGAYGSPGPWQVPKQTFFSASQYSADCTNAAYPASSQWVGAEGPGAGHVELIPACRITNAPIVNMQWIQDNLVAGGYTYSIAYPLKNWGTGHALVFYMKPCWPGVPNEIGNLNCYQGLARVSDAGWQNQFAPVTVRVPSGEGPGAMMSMTYTYGSPNGDRIGAWPSPGREIGVIGTLYGANVELPVYSPNSVMLPMLDDWLSGQPPAPPPTASLPSTPPYVPAGDPSAINVGGVSSGGGAGAAGVTDIDGRNTLKFDFAAFCSAPGKDGQPRSPAWIESCMGGH